MIRVLHVADVGTEVQTRRSVEYLLRGLGEGFACGVRTIGTGGDWRGMAEAVRGLRKENIELVHAWGESALTAAAMGARGRIVYGAGVEVRRRDVRWLRAVMAYREVRVVCPTGAMQRAMVSEGVDVERCEVIRPGVDFGKARRRRDAGLRAALGFDEGDYVLLGVGESTAGASHEDAVWAAGILHELDGRYKLLLWGRGERVAAVKAFAMETVGEGVLHLAEEKLGRRVEFEQLLGAGDMAINTAAGSAATWPVAVCMAAALPIVSTVTYAASELLEDHHTAILVPKHSPKLMARRVVELREDAGLPWRIADRARAEAYEYCSMTGFVEGYRELYRRCVGQGDVRIMADSTR